MLRVLAAAGIRPSVDLLLARARSLGVAARSGILDVADSYDEQGLEIQTRFLHDSSDALKRQAIESMKRSAGMESIQTLLAFAANPARPLALRNEAEQAVEAIRSRVGSQSGSLTLLEETSVTGALSVESLHVDVGLELTTD